MFGFKSKKDKRIEELEAMLFMRGTPRIIESKHNITTLGARLILEPDMPVEYAKEILARKMTEQIKDSMTYDLEDDSERHKILRATLKIVEVEL